jgi:hypothetical protein
MTFSRAKTLNIMNDNIYSIISFLVFVFVVILTMSVFKGKHDQRVEKLDFLKKLFFGKNDPPIESTPRSTVYSTPRSTVYSTPRSTVYSTPSSTVYSTPLTIAGYNYDIAQTAIIELHTTMQNNYQGSAPDLNNLLELSTTQQDVLTELSSKMVDRSIAFNFHERVVQLLTYLSASAGFNYNTLLTTLIANSSRVSESPPPYHPLYTQLVEVAEDEVKSITTLTTSLTAREKTAYRTWTRDGYRLMFEIPEGFLDNFSDTLITINEYMPQYSSEENAFLIYEILTRKIESGKRVILRVKEVTDTNDDILDEIESNLAILKAFLGEVPPTLTTDYEINAQKFVDYSQFYIDVALALVDNSVISGDLFSLHLIDEEEEVTMR